MAGNAEACEKVKYTETGSFAGSVAGGAGSAAILTAPAVGSVCAALGVPTGGVGTLVCGLVVVGTGSLVIGALGGAGGEMAGDVIYESSK